MIAEVIFLIGLIRAALTLKHTQHTQNRAIAMQRHLR